MDLWLILFYIGIGRIIYTILGCLYSRVFTKIYLDNYRYGWILITGASDGIGKEIAAVLAKQGFKLILVSRNKLKLEKVVNLLKSSTGNTMIHSHSVDFSCSHQNPEEFYKNFFRTLESYEISGLVNNVGVCEYRFFADHSLETIENMLSVNLYPVTMLTHTLLPKFIKRYEEAKQRSLIMNLSSTVDLISIPTTAVYTATKTFVDHLSESVRRENSPGVDIATIKPGVVATNMSSAELGNGLDALPLTVKTNEYAEYLMSHLHTGINYGHWKHYILVFILTLLPYQLTTYLLIKLLPVFERLGLVKHN